MNKTLFLLRPSCPAFFAKVGFGIAEVVFLSLEELFPVVFFAAGFGVATFFATGFALLLVACCAFGLIVAAGGGIAALVIFVAALLAFGFLSAGGVIFLAVEVFSSVAAAFGFASAFGGILTFFSGYLYGHFASVPAGTVQCFHYVVGFFLLYFEEGELRHQVDASQLDASAGVAIQETDQFAGEEVIHLAQVDEEAGTFSSRRFTPCP